MFYTTNYNFSRFKNFNWDKSIMKKILFIIFLIFFNKLYSQDLNLEICQIEREFHDVQKCDYDWTIVGAGPAGIITIGVLLDLGVLPSRINWVDPEFNVGRLSVYSSVPSNTKNKLLINFLVSCKFFNSCVPSDIQELQKLDPDREYPLKTIVDPLQKITENIKQLTDISTGHLTSLYFKDDSWIVGTENINFSSYNVVLATGSHPKKLDLPEYANKEIALDIALDKLKLEAYLNKQDVVGVVGASHSAILLLKYLSEMNIKKIYNFFNKPIEYAIDMGGWLLNSTSGLKGVTAQWAKNVLEKNPPKNLIRVQSNEENLNKFLSDCTRVIYAIGYERNELPEINGVKDVTYDPSTGVIAKRLFGIGIAFPDKWVDPLGNTEYRVGFNSFLNYAQRVVPCWMQRYGINNFNRHAVDSLTVFEELFNIEIL